MGSGRLRIVKASLPWAVTGDIMACLADHAMALRSGAPNANRIVARGNAAVRRRLPMLKAWCVVEGEGEVAFVGDTRVTGRGGDNSERLGEGSPQQAVLRPERRHR